MGRFSKIAAGLGLAALSGGPALALDPPTPGRWFVAGFGGISLQRDQTSRVFDGPDNLGFGGVQTTGDVTVFADFDTGPALGVRAGYLFGLFDSAVGPLRSRLALDHIYRENDISGLVVQGTDATVPIDSDAADIGSFAGDQSSNAFHGLAVLEFHGLERFVPYFGVGLGVAGVESDVTVLTDFGDGPVTQEFGGSVDAVLSYEILGGLLWRFTRQIDVMIEARFIEATDPTFDLSPTGADGGRLDFDSEFSHFHLMAGVQFTF